MRNKSNIDQELLVSTLRLDAYARGQHGTPEAVSDALKLSLHADRLVEEDMQRKVRWKYLCGAKCDDMDEKALSTIRTPDGGCFVGTEDIPDALPLIQTYSPIDQYATIRTLTTDTEYSLPKEKTRPQNLWRHETDFHPITGEMTYGGEKIYTHPLVSTIAVSAKLAEDADMAKEILRAVFEAFLVSEATEFVKGNGVGRPEGLLTHTGIATVNSGHASQVTADGITSLYFKLPQAFRRNGVWMMNGNTLEAAKKLKDSSGAYIYKEGLFGLAPDTLHGRPVIECVDMPDIAAGNTPILFGDLSRYYIVRRLDMSVLRDPFSAKPMVIFDCVRRVGGQVVDPSAFRKQLISV